MKLQIKHINKCLQQLGVSDQIEVNTFEQNFPMPFDQEEGSILFSLPSSSENQTEYFLGCTDFPMQIEGESTPIGIMQITTTITTQLKLKPSTEFLEAVEVVNKRYKTSWKILTGKLEFEYLKYYYNDSGSYREGRKYIESDIALEEKEFFEYFQKVWSGSKSLEELDGLIADEKSLESDRKQDERSKAMIQEMTKSLIQSNLMLEQKRMEGERKQDERLRAMMQEMTKSLIQSNLILEQKRMEGERKQEERLKAMIQELKVSSVQTKIIDYIVLSSGLGETNNLEKQIKEYILDGWEPLGGMVDTSWGETSGDIEDGTGYISTETQVDFIQTMIKRA